MADHDVNGDEKIDFEEFQVLFRRILSKAIRSDSEILKLQRMRADQMADLRAQMANRKVFLKKNFILFKFLNKFLIILDLWRPG